MNKITTLFSAASLALAASISLVACGDDSSSASNDEQPGSSNAAEEKLEEGKECPAESEGVYASVLDTLAVYEDGNAMVWSHYYHCESGKWVETECRDPQEACTADNDGEKKSVVCTQQPDNPKATKTEWNFVCNDKKWEKLTAEEAKAARIEAQCTTPETKIGDVCSVSGYIVATGANYQDCYLYTEKGWTYMNQSFSSCRIVYHVPDSVQFLEMIEIKTECNAENEGLYEMVIVPVKDRGEETRVRYDFRCKSGRWVETEEPSDIAGQCTKAGTKIGDVCSIVSGGDVSAGIMPNILNCYVYTEEGWVSKASGSPYGSSCEELVNAPADSTAAED